ncbi:MAG: GH1 family beta-glucosidase, partial [Armatimonadota bacterium]|nr:GH1 family beta-glucosidase [Armatimonadota bacterium]
MSACRFPDGFVWGAATAAYQIEGSPLADGAGASIWHRFSHTPGTTHNGDTGDVACDHYHRWRDDVAMMRELGLKAYRFSINWGRILPEGKGAVNPAGLDFYDRLVDALLEADILPMVTLYHWDLPGALQDLGGWANREIVHWFGDYAQVVAERLGDRVRWWATLNEPWVFTFIGYVTGHHAPGMRDLWAGMRAAHHSLLAHGEAVARMRGILPAQAQVGIVLNLSPQHPASESEEDKAAAERVHVMQNALFVEPLLKGSYPALAERIASDFWPPVQSGDMERIAQPIDFLGVNYYSRGIVRHAPHGYLQAEGVHNEGAQYTEMGWEVYPAGLYEILQWVHSLSPRLSLYITENGAAFRDEVRDGRVADADRVEYLRQHFLSAHRAIGDGVPLKGYFVWSLMDNFEWAYGYSRRFGIVYVDYATQQRIWKDSAR